MAMRVGHKSLRSPVAVEQFREQQPCSAQVARVPRMAMEGDAIIGPAREPSRKRRKSLCERESRCVPERLGRKAERELSRQRMKGIRVSVPKSQARAVGMATAQLSDKSAHRRLNPGPGGIPRGVPGGDVNERAIVHKRKNGSGFTVEEAGSRETTPAIASRRRVAL